MANPLLFEIPGDLKKRKTTARRSLGGSGSSSELDGWRLEFSFLSLKITVRFGAYEPCCIDTGYEKHYIAHN